MIAGTDKQDEVLQPQAKSLVSKRNVKLVVTLIIVLTALLYLKPSFTAWQSGAFSVGSSDILTAIVERGELVRDVSVNGRVIAANAPQLYASESGQVSYLKKPGQVVTKGDVLAVVTSPELKSKLDQETASLAQLKLDAERGQLSDKEALLDLESSLDTAKVKLVAAKREMERAELSFEKKVIKEVDYAKTKDALLEAELFFKHAQKRIALSKDRLAFEKKTREYSVKKQAFVVEELKRRTADLSIQSPVDGIVGNWLVADKDKVSANTGLITVVDLREYEAQLEVPEFYADELGLGLPVVLKAGAVTMQGQIIAISPEIVASQIQVKASINKLDHQNLRQNQRLTARIEFERKSDTLKVKRGAFVGSAGGRYAYVVEPSGLAMQTPINVGVQSVDYVEVTGLKEGDEIVISDYQKFEQAKYLQIEQD